MCSHPRRRFLGRLAIGGFALTPLAALLSGCEKSGWPAGMTAIKWDRDTCALCSMVISDHRFAGQMRGGPDNTVFKFDDPGCMAIWLRDKAEKYPWLAEAATRMWVADYESKGRDGIHWLDPRRAYYIARSSPMGFNFAAVAAPQGGAIDFNDMRQHVLARLKK